MHTQYKQSHSTLSDSDHKQGFVILIAVLVSSLVISLGAFIAGIAVKELALSTSGRDSQVAFYAADAAIECALYQDLHIEAFTASSSASGPVDINCNSSTTVIVINNDLSNANRGVSEFFVSFPDNAGDNVAYSPYARVRITKSNIGTVDDETIIESRGYNVKDTAVSKRVERALEVSY